MEGTKVAVSKSIFGRARNRAENRRKNDVLNMLLEEESRVNYLYSFKIQPGKDLDETETRPVPKCCTNCLPDSDAHLTLKEDVKYSGLVNCFIPPTTSPYNSTLTRMFPFYSHYTRCCKNVSQAKLPEWKELEQDPKLLSVYPGRSGRDFDEIKRDVLEILQKLQVSTIWKVLAKPFLWISAWLCKKYLSTYFEAVLVHGAQIEMLRDVHAKNLPIIYIPTYRSWLDKVLILWVLANNGFQTPMFIPGHNANQVLAKYYGGIGATLKVKTDRTSDLKYSAALATYFRHLVKKKNSILINVEVGRSRTGRPSPHVYGTELLRVIYDQYINREVEDVYIVPVSISYESLPDMPDLFRLPLKKSKPSPQSLLGIFRKCIADWIYPNFKKGIAKVDFAQPICLRELDKSLQKNSKIHRCLSGQTDSYHQSRDCSFLRWNSTDSLHSVASLYGEFSPLYPDDAGQEKKAVLLDVMNHHLLYDAGRCESIMPTHLVSFALLKRSKGGLYLDQLKDDLQWLIKVIRMRKKDFGFAIIDCDMETIITRAVEVLSQDIVCQWDNEKQSYYLKANNDKESLRRLEYYANYILPDFMMEAIIATAIFTICGSQLTVLRGFDIELVIRDEDFIRHCRRIYEVFTGAFLLHAPCYSAESAIRNEIAQMADIGTIILVMRDARTYQVYDDDDSEDEYDERYGKQEMISDHDFCIVPEAVKILTSHETFKKLNFSRSLATPYLKVYAFLTRSLKVLINEDEDNEMEMSKLENILLELLTKESNREINNYCELVNMDTIKSFLVTCQDHGFIFCRTEPTENTRIYRLDERFHENGSERLDKQAFDIMNYVTN